MRECTIIGSGSDIAVELWERLEADGWSVHGAEGHEYRVPVYKWDLLILAHGTLEPIGKFFDCGTDAFMQAMFVNAFLPLSMLRAAWKFRKPDATVVFIGGPNMAKPSPTYTSYRAGKAMIESLVTTLEAEYPETHFRVLHPGVVNTKIHQQTLGSSHAANYERVQRIVSGEEPTVSHDQVYERLKALL